MEIVWSELATITYYEILENLQEYWTKKEMVKFVELTDHLLQRIKDREIVCPVVNVGRGIRKGIIHRNVSVFYIEDHKDSRIYIITFFNNRMDPETLRKLLRS